MPDYSKKIVYLSKAQYQELITNESITVNGVAVNYNENDIYVTPQDEPVVDVQVDGTSVVSNGVANIPYASDSTPGVIKAFSGKGLYVDETGTITFDPAPTALIKSGVSQKRIIAPFNQDAAVFYGLAKASGDTTQSQSSNEVGIYTDSAKAAIQTMLGVPGKTDVAVIPGTGDSSAKTKDYISGSGTTYTNTASGYASFAHGVGTTASGGASHSDGVQTEATGFASHSEGRYTHAAGNSSHAEGLDTHANGGQSHAEGVYTYADGDRSHAEGAYTVAAGDESHVFGIRNVPDSFDNWQEWTANTTYAVGDKVKRTITSNGETTITAYVCKTANSDSSFTSSKWTSLGGRMNFVEIVGNALSNSTSDDPSNAYALDWDGNGYYAGNVYVNCNNDSTGGSKVATVSEIPDISGKADKTDTVLTTTLSRGRKANTTIGTGSIAFGNNVEASGEYSMAIGRSVVASGHESIAEGFDTIASGSNSHSEGNGTIANGSNVHAEGRFNVEQTIFPDWVANTHYYIGDCVYHSPTTYECIEENTDASWVSSKWKEINLTSDSLLVVGNGAGVLNRSNALKLKYNGDLKLNGNVYVGCAADSTGGTKLASEDDVAVIPDTGAGSAKTKGYTGSSGTIYTNTASGNGSFAEGRSTTASGTSSHAEGVSSVASNTATHAEGHTTEASGYSSHAEGRNTVASGNSAHAEGYMTVASSLQSHAEGAGTIAGGAQSHVSGNYNVEDSCNNWPEWAANTSYAVGDRVKVTTESGNETTVNGYICIAANSSSSFNTSDWTDTQGKAYYAEIIGNGRYGARSNARALDWDGNERLAGNVYVNCNADSTGGTRLPHDVQVDGTSVVSNGVANIPRAGTNTLGVVKIRTGGEGGLQLISSGTAAVFCADAGLVKQGTNQYRPIVPLLQGNSTFYGLAKAAGDTTQSESSNAVGAYTDSAKASIQHLLGTDTIIAPNETDLGNATRAYKIGETFTMNGKLYKATDAISQNGLITSGINCQETSVASQLNDIPVEAGSAGGAVQTKSCILNGITYSQIASGAGSFAEGVHTYASGSASHAEGYWTTASGKQTHAEGYYTFATATAAHSEGYWTKALGGYSHVAGKFNVEDSYNNWSEWTANTSYSVGDKVKVTTIANNETTVTGYICKTSNSDASFTLSKWDQTPMMNYAEIIGNGTASDNLSNARTLDWNGNERLAGYVYVNCNADSTGGTMLPADVQVNGTSIVSNGIANVPVASNGSLGLVKPTSTYGVIVNSGGWLSLNAATSEQVKNGTAVYATTLPNLQHAAAFYGLAKAAGDSTQSTSSNAVGVYTSQAKAAIQNMLGVEPGVSFVETISDTEPEITCEPNVRYVCGEVLSISITPPASGIADIMFESGSTAAVLSIPNTVIFPDWVDLTTLEANTTYEIMITDGVYGSMMKWSNGGASA